MFSLYRRFLYSARRCCGTTCNITSKVEGQRKKIRCENSISSSEKRPRSSFDEVEHFFIWRLALKQHKVFSTPHTFLDFPHDAATSLDAGDAGVKDDVRFHRRLGSRFTSLCDQDKSHGAAEVAFHVLHNDVALRLRWAREALRLLRESPAAATAPRRLVVLLLYSHTQHDVAVGRHMRRVCEHVRAMLAERHEKVLGVLTVAVGAKWRDLEAVRERDRGQKGAERGKKKHDCDDSRGRTGLQDDILWYPNAGLYTFNALLHCFCHVELSAVGDKTGCPSLELHRRILIISESWSHVRTATELHKLRGMHCGTCEDTVDVEPMPFVLGAAHSSEELLQFARYTACRAIAP